MSKTRISIYEYSDYRLFLQDYFEMLREKSPARFSFRSLAMRMDLGSPNYIQLVMKGKRNLSEKMIPRFAQGLKLSSQQSHFWEDLVHFTQASSVQQKDLYFQRLLKYRTYREMARLKQEQYRYLSQWYFVVIRELVGLPGFREDKAWIAKRLGGVIDAVEVGKAIDLLLSLGLLSRDSEGKLCQSDVNIETSETIRSISAYQFHKQMIGRGLASLEKPSSGRFVTGMTIRFPQEKFAQFKTEVFNTLKALQKKAEQYQDSADNIYQINVQFFTLTRDIKAEKL